jgi:hypothetical protein
VRFVCLIRVPVCPVCVPAPPGLFMEEPTSALLAQAVRVQYCFSLYCYRGHASAARAFIIISPTALEQARGGALGAGGGRVGFAGGGLF